MKSPSFNFVPEKQLRDVPTGNGFWKVTILYKPMGSAIYFPNEMVYALEMDGKYLQVFADIEKKSIGWSIISDETTLETINGARKLNKNKQSGAILVGVGKILKSLNYPITKTVKGLQVKTYVSPLVKESISYVVLPDIEVSVV